MEDCNSNNKLNLLNINKKEKSVSDREILSVIKEEKHFPVKFSRPIKLSLLVKYFNKYWNNEFTDESFSDEESDDVPYKSIFDNR